MSIEQDCGQECKPFIHILESLYKLGENEKPNYREIDFKLSLVLIDANEDPQKPIFESQQGNNSLQIGNLEDFDDGLFTDICDDDFGASSYQENVYFRHVKTKISILQAWFYEWF